MKISNHAFSEKEIEDLEIYVDNQKKWPFENEICCVVNDSSGDII